MSAIATGLGVLIDTLDGSAGGGNAQVTQDDLVPVIRDIVAAFTVIKDALDAADKAATASVTAATDAATQIEQIGSDVKDITEHTYQVVIPRSMSWLAGYLISGAVDQVRSVIGADLHKIDFLDGWRGQIDTWRNDHVDPELTAWRSFKAWFDTWPTSILTTWHGWFQRPAEFGAWAAPPLIGPLVSYLADGQHKRLRDDLSLILVKAWTDEPTLVMDAVIAWLVS